jgi:hypothetical protein
MADRLIPNSTTPGAVTGDDFMDAVQDELTGLWTAANIFLGSVGGTANAITATADPDLIGGALSHGMGFYLVPAANSTGAVTLQVGSAAAKAMVDKDGNALTSGALVAGRRYALVYDGGASAFVTVTDVGNPTAVPSSYVDVQKFTASGTWTKPSRANANSVTEIIAWGAGGGATSANPCGGGGGGACVSRRISTSLLGSTETVTVPAGGAIGSNGGNCTFGSWVTAYGGGRGDANYGGGGGGALGAGVLNVPGGPAPGTQSASAAGGDSTAGGAGGGGNGNYAGGNSERGGGGGGGSSSSGVGGASLWGGGGGGGGTNSAGAAGGVSKYGGNGGAGNTAGSAPGGGGGRNAAGGRGECWVITYI